jgi:signal transduction histidine kinase
VNNAIQIDVIDNGEGISESSINKIFDMFYRGSTNSAGTGLGLYICKEIAEKMNGIISVTSQKGEGSTFSLTLPAAPYQNQNTPAKHQKI